MGFNVTCTPGRESAVAFMQVTPELPALVLYLDPVNMAIQLPAIPDGPHILARFCRELSREAGRLADALDRPVEAASRHEPRGEAGADE
ncbi:MAG TPA: hypothetical protein VFV67_15410 [Actinophytocola sp.]|uniref:hypothetical protein n=1 Tax=Actinophytocola sp. TaxID=1872138 RepID=UPI002DB7B817|nr:hypothetical protein [Actinophytocola sp.]HEU5472039.1 hypothetical protein [Actinophytocola sp.]